MSEQVSSKTILCALLLMLAGCGMTDDDIREAKAECVAKGGKPVVMARLTGAVAEVRCW